MNEERVVLEIQSYLDGELEVERSRQLERRLAVDGRLSGLYEELRRTRDALRAGEPQPAVPLSREFYWSRIRREIERGETAKAASVRRSGAPRGLGWLLRWAAPLAGGVAVVALIVVQRPVVLPEEDVHQVLTETVAPEMTAFNFRSESARMTVVWVQRVDRRR